VRDIGLVGVPFSGKSTLFTALTRTGGHGGRANHAVVPVPDPRVDVLTEIERSRKTVHAQVGFVDVPGGTASAQGIAKLREADALAIVVRCFGPDAEPASEVSEVRADLLLADQAVIEPALEKAEKRARGKRTPEVEALAAANAALQAEIPLSDARLSEEHRRELKPIAPLTIKPSIVVANLEEGTDVPEGLPEGTVGVYASIEAETAEMEPAEARALLDEFGVHEPGLETVIRRATGDRPDHVPHDRGRRDPRMGGPQRGEGARGRGRDPHRSRTRVHPRRGDPVRRAGRGRLDGRRQAAGQGPVEGKDYEVREGDILHVRFASEDPSVLARLPS
jgi:ribosome-binding ATPase YchF (GTP1/OBG family)